MLSAADIAQAAAGAAEAVEALVHLPFRGGVEEGQLFALPEAAAAGKDGEGGHVEDLLLGWGGSVMRALKRGR